MKMSALRTPVVTCLLLLLLSCVEESFGKHEIGTVAMPPDAAGELLRAVPRFLRTNTVSAMHAADSTNLQPSEAASTGDFQVCVETRE